MQSSTLERSSTAWGAGGWHDAETGGPGLSYGSFRQPAAAFHSRSRSYTIAPRTCFQIICYRVNPLGGACSGVHPWRCQHHHDSPGQPTGLSQVICGLPSSDFRRIDRANCLSELPISRHLKIIRHGNQGFRASFNTSAIPTSIARRCDLW